MAITKSPYKEIGVSIASILGNKDEVAFKRREKRRIEAKKYRDGKNQKA